eukprot:GILK01006978.1.p1 GENE.GILK01006978.1~~GILK01006978.1.p1  ORF type:complete len:451 (-),score=22.95 GILK01006978.1:120-1472(-)
MEPDPNVLLFVIGQMTHALQTMRRVMRKRKERVDRNHHLHLIPGLLGMLTSSVSSLQGPRMVLPKSSNRISTWFCCTILQSTEAEFKSHLRLSKRTFCLLCTELSPAICKADLSEEDFKQPLLLRVGRTGRPQYNAVMQTAIFLWYTSNSITIRLIALQFGVALSTVHSMIRKVAKQICSDLLPRYIRWPSTTNEFRQIEKDFYNRQRFPRVVGAVDGSHIAIRPPRVHPDSYVNRKGYHSMVLQAIATADRRFIDVYVGWPGSSHDAKIFAASPIVNGVDSKVPIGWYILGDSAYPQRTYTCTPFKDYGNLSPRHKQFNYRHSSTRIVVEHTFGILKQRFRVLLKGVESSDVEFVSHIVTSCCVLHNMCSQLSDELPEQYVSDVDEGGDSTHDDPDDSDGLEDAESSDLEFHGALSGAGATDSAYEHNQVQSGIRHRQQVLDIVMSTPM